MRLILTILLFLLAIPGFAQVESTFYFADGNGNVVYTDDVVSISIYDKNTFENYSVIQYKDDAINTLLSYFQIADSIFITSKPTKSILIGKIDGITYWYSPIKKYGKNSYDLMLRIPEGNKKYTIRYYTPSTLIPLLTVGRDIYIDTSRAYYQSLAEHAELYLDETLTQIMMIH